MAIAAAAAVGIGSKSATVTSPLFAWRAAVMKLSDAVGVARQPQAEQRFDAHSAPLVTASERARVSLSESRIQAYVDDHDRSAR